MRRFGLVTASLSALVSGAALAQQAPLSQPVLPVEIVVVGHRLSPAAERIYGTQTIDAVTLEQAPQRQLDAALRSVPGFSLFRRTDSRTSHPTAQGVSLRALGPNGAGRTLVVVDDVPVNDPFGGWVYWTRLPTAAIREVAITPGAGAGPWGNQALAGVIRVDTRTFNGAELQVGNHGLYAATAGITGGGFGLVAHAARTDGMPLVREGQRGPVDVPAREQDGWAELRWAGQNADWAIDTKLAVFREHRVNGTALQENATDAVEASVRLVRAKGPFDTPLRIVLYGRLYEFENRFSSVGAGRASEVGALDQYKVPARAVGGSLASSAELDRDRSVSFGADLRWADGETRESFLLQNGVFQRDRRAGGTQLIGGAHAEFLWSVTEHLTLQIGGRADHWRMFDGSRVERTITTGAAVRNDRFGDRSGTVPSARIGAEWRATPDVAVRAAGYSGFRVPTINELYRPYRVGNDIVEANQALKVERLLGVEAGVTWQAAPAWQLGLTVYRDILFDGVDNVLIQETPGAVPGFAGQTVVAGGSFAQRRNLDRVSATGLEARISGRLLPGLTASLSYLLSRSVVIASNEFPELVGKRLSQSPLHQGTVALDWNPVERLGLHASVRGTGRQFDDGRNERSLGPVLTADLGADYRVSRQLTLFATAENLAGREVESGRRGDGLVNIAAGRQVSGGLRFSW